MDEQKLTVCEEMMKIQIAFFEKLGMQKIADHCVRIMEDFVTALSVVMSRPLTTPHS